MRALMRIQGRGEHGQAGLFMALALFFFVVPMMVAVFDVGLLMNDRRDAQSDADRAALAGAQDLTLNTAATGWSTAEASARDWLTRNGVDPDTEATILPATASDCYGGSLPAGVELYYANTPVGVTVNIHRQSPSFLAGAIGVDLQTGSWATSCAGVPVEHFGIFPLVVSQQGLIGTCFDSDGQPIPGADCKVRVENTSGLVGALSVAYDGTEEVECTSTGSGADDLENNLEFGVQGWCRVGQEVTAKTGETLNKTFNGVKARLTHDGGCDAAYQASGGTAGALSSAWNALGAYLASYPGYSYTPMRTSDNRGPIPGLGDGIDDFYEVWQYAGPSSPASGLEPRACPGYDGETNSPRNIVLIIVPDALDTSGSSGQKYTIQQFARMYLEGCTLTTTTGRRETSEFRRDCSWGSLGSGRLTINARYVHQVGSPNANLGLSQLIIGDIGTFLKR